jgi:hypothetical protein
MITVGNYSANEGMRIDSVKEGAVVKSVLFSSPRVERPKLLAYGM